MEVFFFFKKKKSLNYCAMQYSDVNNNNTCISFHAINIIIWLCLFSLLYLFY